MQRKEDKQNDAFEQDSINSQGSDSYELEPVQDFEIEQNDQRVEAIREARDAFATLNSCLQTANGISEQLASAAVSWKEVEREMVRMDVDFQRFEKELDAELAKYKGRLPRIERQLDVANDSLSKLLDKALAIDPKSETELQLKMKMLDKVGDAMNMITSTMLKFL